jgi:hypothetical protein
MRPDGKLRGSWDNLFLSKFRKSDCGLWVPLQILQSVSRLRIEFSKKDYSETIINNLPGIFYLYDESENFKME